MEQPTRYRVVVLRLTAFPLLKRDKYPIRIVGRFVNTSTKLFDGALIMNRRYFISSVIAVGACAALPQLPIISGSSQDGNHRKAKGIIKVTKTNEEWKQILTPEQYSVTREKGTERPFSSSLKNFTKNGN